MSGDLGARFIDWAMGSPGVLALVQIGSHTRTRGVAAADKFSDWDFQVVTDGPVLASREAFKAAGMGEPKIVVERGGRLGSSRKLTAIFSEGELDLVIIPVQQVNGVLHAVREGKHREAPALMSALVDLARVLQGGWAIRKGADVVTELIRHVQQEIAVPALSDDEICALAGGFVCDFISARRKLARGELLATQRWLHVNLAETNFRFLHELHLRGGKETYPDARRVEWIGTTEEVDAVRVDSLPTVDSLQTGLAKSADTCRRLVARLVGQQWQWPDVPQA